jgi:hypothetical protein
VNSKRKWFRHTLAMSYAAKCSHFFLLEWLGLSARDEALYMFRTPMLMTSLSSRFWSVIASMVGVNNWSFRS